jgi:hypothetical protein
MFSQIGTPADLPTGNHWLGFQSGVIARNTQVVERSSAYLDARRRQSDAYTALIDARMRIARKIAELADLHNVLSEDQREREHRRWQAEVARAAARGQADYDRRFADARNEAELARLQEIVVRAQRNLEAAERVKEAEIDRWYAEAQSRTNNAKAEFQDTAVDLARGAPADATGSAPNDAAGQQKAQDMALLDHQIELERSRGNEGAVLALLNLKALLKAA